MFTSLYNLFFKKKLSSLKNTDSLVLEKIKSIVNFNHDVYLYENVTIYHYDKSYFIPLLFIDTKKGIYLLEHKAWLFDELKNSTIESAHNQKFLDNTLSFENSRDIINLKLDEIGNIDGVPIFNYLIMENLSSFEYDELSDLFKNLLPKEKILFKDMDIPDILQKLHSGIVARDDLPSIENIVGNLLIQYTILNDDNTLHICNKEQIEFINSDILAIVSLKNRPLSGKTSVILLKAIYEKLKYPDKRVIIIQRTTLACDILKKRLLNTIEHAIIGVDPTSIKIMTPLELLNIHLQTLNKDTLDTELKVDDILMKKAFDIADLIMCDDSFVLPLEFVGYLRQLQIKSDLLLVGAENIDKQYLFTKSFEFEKKDIHFLQTNPYVKAMQIISNLLVDNLPEDIMVVSDDLNQKKLNDELKFFIDNKAVLLDSSINLVNQDLEHLLLVKYSDIHGLRAKFVIILEPCDVSVDEFKYAVDICYDTVYILYEDECEGIKEIDDKSKKELKRVERTT